MFDDFRSSPMMLCLALGVAAFIIGQSVFFLVRAWKRGKQIGFTTEKLKNTITSSAVFSVAPAIGIAITVIALATSLGYVLPWIRLTVIGSISYETMAAESAIKNAGAGASTTDPLIFSTVTWVMTLGSLVAIILVPLLAKKIQKTVSGVASKNNKLVDLVSAAAFIGIIAAFLANGLTGVGEQYSADNVFNPISYDGAGVLSVTAIVSSVVYMLIFSLINRKLKKNWIEAMSLPLSMVLAIITVILVCYVAPEAAMLEWRY